MELLESEWFALAVLIAGTILAVRGVIDGPAWVSLVMTLVAHKAWSASSNTTTP